MNNLSITNKMMLKRNPDYRLSLSNQRNSFLNKNDFRYNARKTYV